jgi:hypothetical protein
MLVGLILLLAVLVFLGAGTALFAWVGAIFARRSHAPVRLWAWIAGGLGLVLSLTFGVIVAAVALPSFLHLRDEPAETSALAHVRAVREAETQYNSVYPQFGYTCNLADLGGTAGTTPGPKNSQLLPDESITGRGRGYTFQFVNCAKVNVDGHDQITYYKILAVPVGHTVNHVLCADPTGIFWDPTGGTNCTQEVK